MSEEQAGYKTNNGAVEYQSRLRAEQGPPAELRTLPPGFVDMAEVRRAREEAEQQRIKPITDRLDRIIELLEALQP